MARNKISLAKSAAQTAGTIYKTDTVWKDLEHPKHFNQTSKTMQKPLFSSCCTGLNSVDPST
jgi:hypothetical protein